jgi:predicted CXXCH cytochrome family protein
MSGQKAEGRRQKWGVTRAFIAVVTSAFCLLPSAYAKNGAYRFTKHGERTCLQCHPSHGAKAPSDNTLCFTCHSAPSSDGVYPGSGVWAETAHARSSSDANKCTGCHDPHGVRDAAGVIPSMLSARETALCLTCHDGARGADIARELTKAYRHSGVARGEHDERRGVCSDCHNAHRIGAGSALPSPPEASIRLAGVSRLQVVNGSAGAAPAYVWRAADDPEPANEYEICFKCHSSWTTQPPGQSNLALLTNPANPSFHPIQAEGKNTFIDPNAFANGVGPQSLVACTDCHSSDEPGIRGPHGSTYRYLLKKPSTTTTAAQAMTPNDICFHCHAYAVYGDAVSDEATQRASRFNMPGAAGHAFHVGAQQIPCYGCHETHGSTRFPALIAARTPGIISYTQTSAGGTCTSSCHGVRTYASTYAR